MSIYEVDKKGFESLNKLFDLTEMKAHIKKCKDFRSYIKSLRKFKSSVESSDETITEGSPAFKSYVDFLKEELDFKRI